MAPDAGRRLVAQDVARHPQRRVAGMAAMTASGVGVADNLLFRSPPHPATLAMLKQLIGP